MALQYHKTAKFHFLYQNSFFTGLPTVPGIISHLQALSNKHKQTITRRDETLNHSQVYSRITLMFCLT